MLRKCWPKDFLVTEPNDDISLMFQNSVMKNYLEITRELLKHCSDEFIHNSEFALEVLDTSLRRL